MPFHHTSAFVLTREPSGESMLHLRLFSAGIGLIHAWLRVSRKRTPATPAPDLFDRLDVVLETKNEGRTWFVKEHVVTRRYTGIGRNYASLRYASRFAALILKNPLHHDAWLPLFESLDHALEAWEHDRHPEIVYFKTLYLYAKGEGFPVREDWWARLPRARQSETELRLHRPLAEQSAPDATGNTKKLIESLESWLQYDHEIRF